MMKHVMKTRVAALAFAALPLTAAPAFAEDAGYRAQTAFSGAMLSVGDASFYISVGGDLWRGRDGRYYTNDRYGQRPWETRQLRRLLNGVMDILGDVDCSFEKVFGELLCACGNDC